MEIILVFVSFQINHFWYT